MECASRSSSSPWSGHKEFFQDEADQASNLTDRSFNNIDCLGRCVDNVASGRLWESSFIVNNAPPFFAGEYLKLARSKFASLYLK